MQVMPWVLGSAGGEGALWAPSLTAELPPGACSWPGASAAGDLGQGRESLGMQHDNVCFHRLCKDTLGPVLAWLRSSQTPAAIGV